MPSPPIADAIKLVKAGVSENIVLAWIDAHTPYDKVSADQIILLKQAGVPDGAIAALVNKGAEFANARQEERQPRAIENVHREGARDDYAIVKKYEVPAGSKRNDVAVEPNTAKTQRPFTEEDAVRYTYREPAERVYVDDTPAVTYIDTTPSYAYTSYPHYVSYPSLYFSYSSYPYARYGYSHYGSGYCGYRGYRGYHGYGSYSHGSHYVSHHGHQSHQGHTGHKAYLSGHLYRK